MAAEIIFYPAGFPEGSPYASWPVLPSNGEEVILYNPDYTPISFRIQFTSDTYLSPANSYFYFDSGGPSLRSTTYHGFSGGIYYYTARANDSIDAGDLGSHSWRVYVLSNQGSATSATYTYSVIEWEGGEIDPPEKATNPHPAHEATGVDFSDRLLSWTNGDGTHSWKLYIGDAPGNLAFVANGAAAYYYPNDSQRALFKATCYWRVDCINDDGTTEGDVWNFTCAAPGKATNPAPGDLITDININLGVLTWDAPI